MNAKLSTVLVILFFALTLLLALRGRTGNPTSLELLSPDWQINGPFELSPERGRFALVYSLIEDHSLSFSSAIAGFANPDVAISKGRYVSLFAPLLSYAAIPGYLVGKYLGAAQVGVFAMVAVFALVNTILIRAIAIRLGSHPAAATIAGAVFLFATPGFAYAVNLYQHHLSAFLILLSIYSLLRFPSAWSLVLVFFLSAVAVPLDYPNLIFMLPIVIFALLRIISWERFADQVLIKVNLPRFLTIFAAFLPMLFFLWFNQASYGSPFQLSGTLQTTKLAQNPGDLASMPQAETLQKTRSSASVLDFFQSRNMLNGFYILIFSPDRGVIYYTPVILLGVVGLMMAVKKGVPCAPLFLSVAGANILLYSMWGDPWGGWAFGSRYLIPSYAILAIFIALLLTYWQKKLAFIILFTAAAFYSVAVNTLGVLTTSAIPPKVEVLQLEQASHLVQKYTYARNWDFLTSGRSKSFVFQTWAGKYVTAIGYYQIVTFLILAFIGAYVAYFTLQEREAK